MSAGTESFYETTTSRPFAEARKRVEEKAGLENFRVLHVHDVQATLREKGFDVGPTVIVVVCNAKTAAEALQADPRSALLMPCKVVVQEKEGQVMLSTFLPESLVEGESLKNLARQVGTRLMSLVDTAAAVPSCCAL